MVLTAKSRKELSEPNPSANRPLGGFLCWLFESAGASQEDAAQTELQLYGGVQILQDPQENKKGPVETAVQE